jgi:hypothetical protein
MRQESHVPESMETENFIGANFDLEKSQHENIKKCDKKCYKNYLNKSCELCGWLSCTFIIILIFYIISQINIEDKTIDNHYIWRHYYKNPPSISDLHSDTYHWSKHHHKKCSDYDYGCCKIFDNNQEFTLSVHIVIPYNKNHSNCPSYRDLIYNYNLWRENYYGKNETDCELKECCKLNTYEDELKNGRNPQGNISDYNVLVKYHKPDITKSYDRCPDIYNIWHEYDIDKYEDPEYSWWPIVLIIICICVCFCIAKS